MKFFFVTGEISGDLHASYLVNSIKKNEKSYEIYGVGGEYMRKEGVKIIQDISELAVMGFSESFKKYKFLKNKANEYIEFIIKEDIKNIILVDYGGFNLRFLELLKNKLKDIKIFYYIPPKLWVWGKNRIKKLIKSDYILVIFPWEVEFYKENNIETVYYGNPFIEKYKVENKENLDNILLLPGSRKQEIVKIMPLYLNIIKKEKNKKFIIKFARMVDYIKYKNILEKYNNVTIEIEKSLNEISKNVKYAIAVSGTVTLELALLEIPGVVVYKTSFINEIIVRLFIKLKYISLPNIAMNEMIYPELLQNNCNYKNILLNFDYIEKNYSEIMIKLKKMKENMYGENIIEKYSDFIIKNSL